MSLTYRAILGFLQDLIANLPEIRSSNEVLKLLDSLKRHPALNKEHESIWHRSQKRSRSRVRASKK